jgi:type II secretory pathway component GspD/PulD (secretin)
VPVLKDMPLIGWAFGRDTYDLEKIDLLIFLTVHVLRPGEAVPPEILNPQPLVSKF